MARVDWREPPALWATLGWMAAILYPPIVFAFTVWWQDIVINGGFVREISLTTLVAGGIGVALILYFVEKERRRYGVPKTRLGVIVRFVALGFFFAVLASVAINILAALVSMFTGVGDIWRRLGEAKATLLEGILLMPIFLIIGTSYAVWAGFVCSLIAFTPRAPRARPSHFMFDRLGAEDTSSDAAPPPPPAPEPAAGPHPETEMEAALRPDWDDA